MFLIVLVIGLALWKGGEPFRILGDGMVIAGKKIQEFADTIDRLKSGGKKVGKQVIEMQETVNEATGKTDTQEKPDGADGNADTGKESE